VALEVFRFSRLAPVCLVWSPSGHQLAFAQGSILLLRDTAGTLRSHMLPGAVQWLGFDHHQRLWSLAGDILSRGPEVAIPGVDAAIANGPIVFVQREPGGTRIYSIDDDAPLLLARVAGDHATVELSSRGDFLVAVLASAARRRQVEALLLRIHIPSGRVDTLLDRTLPCGFNAGPGLDATVTRTGEVWAAFEHGDCTQVWQLLPGALPTPVTSSGLEVGDFVLDRSGDAIAVLVSDIRQTSGSFETALLLGRRTSTGWQFQPAIPGVHDMPRWRADGKMHILCGTSGRWQRATYAAGPPPTPNVLPCRVAPLPGRADLDLLRLSGSEHRKFGIILLPRLHQRFLAGAQPSMFHHMLFCIARSLAADGYTVVTMSGPGAIGRGRQRRAIANSYLRAVGACIRDITCHLGNTGCHSFGLLAGSLAGVPALRLLGPQSALSAAAFVVPLFEASIPLTAPVRDILLEDPLMPSLETAAANLQVPLRVVYAANDEVAPTSQIDRLRQHVADSRLVTLHPLRNEGHIFGRMSSWTEARSAISLFFESQQAPN
jgi:hypothetical protein